MAGEESTQCPVSNSQRTVPGLIGGGFGLEFLRAFLVLGGFFAVYFTSFFPHPPRHKHKANKAMKVGFIALSLQLLIYQYQHHTNAQAVHISALN